MSILKNIMSPQFLQETGTARIMFNGIFNDTDASVILAKFSYTYDFFVILEFEFYP